MSESEKDYPTVDGAPINPYDLPGQPRPEKASAKGKAKAKGEELADVPGPGGEPKEPTTADK